MTDQELIQLLQQKSAGELTSTEVAEIRARWTQSPELRQALVEHLQLETQLLGGLNPVAVDVDAILERASQQKKTDRKNSSPWTWLIGPCLIMAAGLGLYYSLPKARQDPLPTDIGSPVSNIETEFPADALLPVNREEASAESAVAVANGETPNVAQSTPPAAPTTTAQPPPKPVQIEIAPNEPWSATLARDAVVWPANSPNLTADFRAAGHDEFPDVEAKKWLSPVEGQPYSWSTDFIGTPARRLSKFQGIAKLRAPWIEDAVLRLTPFEVTDLTLYFWRGPAGVAFRFNTKREPHLWTAYEISRENSSPKPARWGMLTTDSGAYFRSTAGMLDIRHQNGDLVLARGGLVLLSVPFAGPPLEVYLEGQFRLRGLSMHRSVPFLNPPENPHKLLFAGPAANMSWAISPESPASYSTAEDGSVSLTADSRDKTGLIAFPFGWLLASANSPSANGLFEVIVNVDSAEPGTGIYLGDRDGRISHQLGFFKDVASQQTTFGILRPGEMRAESNHNPNELPPPYLAKSSWFKLVAGLGTLHIQTSGDGRHWGHVIESPGRDLPGAVGSMGLYALPGPAARTLKIRHLEIRELTGVTESANPQLRTRVPLFGNDHLRDLAAWNHAVFDSLPAGVSPDEWFTACAVGTLSQGPPKDLGVQLLRQFVKVGLRSTRSFEQKRLMVDDACSLTDLFDDGASRTLGLAYEELGWQLAGSGDTRPLVKVRPAWIWSPIWTASRMRYVWERLHSFEILEAVYRREWAAAWNAARSAAYWNLVPHPDQRPVERGEDLDRHARWAKALVAEAAPQMDDGSAGVLPIGWRHPLMPSLNKEAYNVRAELQSALTGQNFEDACRIVMSIAEHEGPGLLPDPDDRQLYVSMTTAIANARQTFPGFAQTMVNVFEPMGQIRVQSAINRRDMLALQTATLQFMGTDAARTAHVSLGDQALSIGQLDVAEQHFRDASIEAGPQWKEILEPRLILALALSGRMTESTLAEMSAQLSSPTINLNGSTLSAADFQALIKDLVARSRLGSALVETRHRPSPPFPMVGQKLELRAQFDGHPGNNPGRWEFRFGDPFGRQFAVATDDQRIYVSNRFQVNAYQIADGKQVWAQGLGSEQGETYALPFAPMKPVLSGSHLFVRRLTKAGPELACLKVEDGQVVWHQRPSHGAASDPVIWNGRLFALTLNKLDEENLQTEATWFDAATGNVVSTVPLFRFRDAPDRQFSGQLSISERVAICTIAGTTACFDSRGQMKWMRRHTLMQKPVDELAEDSRLSAPVLQAGRVIVAMPGVREISCLDLDSGALIWEQPVVNVRGILGVSESRVLVDTASGVAALDNRTGDIAWQRPVEARLEAVHVGDNTVTIARRVTYQNGRSKPALIWLDLETGRELGQSLVDVADREEFQLGPLFSAGNRWWTLAGQTWKEPKRDLYEFFANPALVPQPFVDEMRIAWTAETPDFQLAETESIIPGWFPVASYRERLVLHSAELRGETNFLLSRLAPLNPVRFTRKLSVPPGGRTTLRLRAGNHPGQKWQLRLVANDRVLLEQEIEDTGSNMGWRDIPVDLSMFAGQDVSLQLIQSAMNNAASDALLKRADLVLE